MARSVGLDITETAVRAAELEGSGRRLRVVRWAEREIAAAEGRSWADAAAEAVTALFAEHRFSREGVVAALDAGDLLLRPLSLPFKSDDQIRKVVKFELESQLQNYAADDLIVDFVVTDRGDKGSQLLAVAAPKEVVKARLALLEKAGVDASALDLDVNALGNAYGRIRERVDDAPFVIAHGAGRFMRLVLVQRGAPRFARALRFTMDPPPGAPPDAPDTDRAVLLAREITRFLLSSQTTEAPVRLVLSGDLARRAGLADRLSTELRLPVVPGLLLDGVEHPFEAEGAPTHLAIAFGLALKGLGIAHSRLDFRQEEFVHRRPYERARRTLVASIVLTALLLLLGAVHYQLQSNDLRGQLDRVLAQQTKLLAEVYPDRVSRVADRERTVEDLKRAWREEQEKTGGTGAGLPPSALEPVGAVFNALRELLAQQTAGGRNAEFHIALESLNYTVPPQSAGQLDFSGQITGPPLAEALQNALKASADFESVSLEGVTARPDGKYNFTIKIKLKKAGA
jgi:Tfp pilus assembly PilM family ATPase